MAKTKEELDQLKKECESLANKLQELTENELMQATGGIATPNPIVIQATQFLQLAPSIVKFDDLGNKVATVEKGIEDIDRGR